MDAYTIAVYMPSRTGRPEQPLVELLGHDIVPETFCMWPVLAHVPQIHGENLGVEHGNWFVEISSVLQDILLRGPLAWLELGGVRILAFPSRDEMELRMLIPFFTHNAFRLWWDAYPYKIGRV